MVSVIVISHNYGQFLTKCINSILTNNLNYLKEIIIVDDASKDNTSDVAKKFKKKNKLIKYYKKDFFSLSKSTNFGIKKAKSRFVTKIDADDYVSKNFLKSFCDEIINKKLDFLYGDLVQIKKNYKKIIKQNYKRKHLFKYPMGSGTIFSKKIWKSVNGFNEKLFFQDDFDFWLRIKKKNSFSFGYINQAHYFYRKHNSNMSKNIIQKNLTKLIVIIKNFL